MLCKKTFLKAIRIAYDVRRRTETYARINDYSVDLCGYCAIASVALVKEMRKAGFRPRVMTDDYHTWVEWCGIIIDITATQFNGQYRRVWIGKVGQTHAHYKYSDKKCMTNKANWAEFGWCLNKSNTMCHLNYQSLLDMKAIRESSWQELAF